MPQERNNQFIVDKYQLVPEFQKVNGVVKQQLNSFNWFLETQIKKIVDDNNEVVASKHPHVKLRFKNARIQRIGILDPTPQTCRLSDQTYAASILVDVKYAAGSHTEPEVKSKNAFVIGKMPIMLRSKGCFLYDRPEEEPVKRGECPLDPGGYFIIKGIEKVMLIQEEPSKNRIVVDTNKKGNVAANVISNTEKIETETIIVMEDGKLRLQLIQFSKKVPLMVVIKGMGMYSDEEFVEMIGSDPRYMGLLWLSIEECTKCGVRTQSQALEYLDSKVKGPMDSNNSAEQPEQEGRAFSVLRDVFLANVPVHEDNFRPKCIYVAVMVRRIMDAILNEDAMDDKDYVGNKRFVLSGQLMSLLFEDVFKSMTTKLQKLTDKVLDSPLPAKKFDMYNSVLLRTKDYITLELERALSTGNFRIKKFRMERKGITQVLSRLSFIGALGHMTRVSAQVENSRKRSGSRALHPSQWGMLCPIDTPIGESCGLVKNLALMAHISTDSHLSTTDEKKDPLKKLVELFYSFGVVDMELLGNQLHAQDSFLVIFNGLILGKHRRPQRFASDIRKLRRAGQIGEFVSVFVNEKQRCVYLDSDGGRVCRPLIIADKGISRIKQHHIKELIDGARTLDHCLDEGLVEYLDVNEENNALIALNEGDATSETTHIEIEPFTMLGVVAGLIPYPHHNQSSSNTSQCAMGKQAMGNIAYNQLHRMDKLLNLLVYPQRPLVSTKTIEIVGYDKLGAGQNAIVAVMSFSGYDIKDAVVMNKASLDRGFGRCIVMKNYNAIIQKYDNGARDRLLRPNRTADTARLTQILDDDGIAAPGEILTPNDIYINKQSPIDTRNKIIGSPKNLPESAYQSTALSFKGHGGEVVDRVVLYTDDDSETVGIKLRIRHTRRPEVGDKFSSRHGHKGVCGAILPQEDFPFSEKGICPDLVINPHGFPSKMTVGKMIELLGAKAGALCCRIHYGSAFGERSGHADQVETISKTLVEKGFSYNGKDFMYSGEMGCPLQAYIFMGPIYYQKSKHMVLDKMHAQGHGPRDMLTRQLKKGVRMGEMERDCLIEYGASMLAYERLMLSSDPFKAQVCGACGLLGYYNYKLKTSICSSCKNGDNISTIKMPYAFKLLTQELQSMHIVPRIKLEDA